MVVIYLLVAVGVSALLFFEESYGLAWMILMPVVFYACFLLRDLHLIHKAASSRRVQGLILPENMLTSAGQKILATLEEQALKTRFCVQEARSQKILDPQKSYTKLSSLLAQSSYRSEHDMLKRVLEYLSAYTQARVMAFIADQIDRGRSQPVVTGALDSARIIETLKQHFSQYLGSELPLGLLKWGLHDVKEWDSAHGQLASFGTRYFSLYRLSWKTVSEHEKGASQTREALLFLGYPEHHPPSDLELKWTEQIAKRIELEFNSFFALHDLSGQVAEAISQSKEKSEFISHISHDIRSPLNNVRAILNLLSIESNEKERQDLIKVAVENCDEMGELLEDILDYSKHQAGKLVPRPESFELGPCLDALVNTFSVSAKIKGLKLKFNRPTYPCQVSCDKRHVKRIISNVLSNAVKFTEKGSIELEVRVSSGFCSVAVKDSGPGISSKDLGALFSPFSRFSRGTTEGIGLGLAVSKILVELNGGRIEVQSKEGQGSEFEISIPVQAALSPAVNHSQLSQRAFLRNEVGKTIMVVDDNRDAVTSLSKNLKYAGYKTIESHNVSQALETIRFDPPDLIITDYEMPEGGGKKIIETINARYPSIPIIVLSGREMKQPICKAKEVMHMTKPVKLARLIALIEENLNSASDQTKLESNIA